MAGLSAVCEGPSASGKMGSAEDVVSYGAEFGFRAMHLTQATSISSVFVSRPPREDKDASLRGR
jgi:hypothetical protein